MGCWGMGMTQSDQFMEVYEAFMEEYNEGASVPEITRKILNQYRKDFSADDSILHDVWFGLAKAEWMCCAQSEEVLARVREIIDSGANIIFLKNGEYMKTVHVVAAVIREGDRVFATQRGYGEQKDGWEFPGGKIEAGETPQQALVREIREELDTGIAVGECLTTIEYDYPAFHLSMQCFWAAICDGEPVLKEHEAARWLRAEELDDVAWLPADLTIIPLIKEKLLQQNA